MPVLMSKCIARLAHVKYLYSHVYKGHDRAITSIQTSEHGEIDQTRHVDEISQTAILRHAMFLRTMLVKGHSGL